MQKKQLVRSTTLTTTGLAILILSSTMNMMPAFAHVCPPDCISEGRMTGGGVIRTINEANGQEVQVTHGFELHCDASDGPNNIQVNWDSGEKFHLESLAFAGCEDQATIDPKPPTAEFDTIVASGFGRLNNGSGAFIFVIFTDAGEPGTSDTATIVIYDSSGNLILNVTYYLDGGNHQAHK